MLKSDEKLSKIGFCFPDIVSSESGYNFGIGCKLPEEVCKKWLPYINGAERFREKIVAKLKSIFAGYVFQAQTYLEIRWSSQGVSFETDGVNGCMVYISSDSGSYGYSSHNIDHYEQASVLFISLSIFLHELYFALDFFESESAVAEKHMSLSERKTDRIELNHQKDCDMDSEECIHWKTIVCEHCSRNPRSFFIKNKKDLDVIGDKWEPEGGLPGKNLCVVCYANISKPICHNCGVDNAGYFQ